MARRIVVVTSPAKVGAYLVEGGTGLLRQTRGWAQVDARYPFDTPQLAHNNPAMGFTHALDRPPGYRFTGPIIDAHCHFGPPAATRAMLRAGAAYGVATWVGIVRIDEVAGYRKRFGDRAAFSIWLDHRKPADAVAWTQGNVDIVARAADAGCHCIKFWYKPEFNHRTGVFFDDPRLDRVFERIVAAGLPVLVHIADPDVWWRHRYHDPARFESKVFTYRQLTNTARRFPDLQIMSAHMGGSPENLAFLDELLETHPNIHLDTSGTKWIARELSHQPAEARAFMIRRADRLLFGSDLVAWKNSTFEHHCSRYWVHRHLYEKDEPICSPIEDPDANGQVYIAGLNLPDAVLQKLYHDNAVKLFRLG